MTRDELNAKRRAKYAENLEESRAKQRATYAKHAGRYRKASLDWYYRNREEATRKWREWRALNPEGNNARVQAWREQNRERLEEYNRRTKESRAESTKAWAAKNREKKRDQWRRYHARKLGAPGRGMTADDWAQIQEVFCGLCAYCLRPCANPEQDHVVALTLGGAHDPENIVPACKSCNSAKRDRTLLQWIALGGAASTARAA